MSKTATQNSITLKGSAAIIKEYLSRHNFVIFVFAPENSFVVFNSKFHSFVCFQIMESTRFFSNVAFIQLRPLILFNSMA